MKDERLHLAGGGAVDGPRGPRQDHRTAPPPAHQVPEAVSIVPEDLIAVLRRLADALDRPAAPPRLAYRLGEIASMLGVSRRLLEQARAAGRLAKPDLRLGKVSLYKIETIRSWLDSRAPGRGGRAS
jgi:hypothetical protein